MSPWGDAEAWDRLAATLNPRLFAHLWAWEHEQVEWRAREAAKDQPYDVERQGL